MFEGVDPVGEIIRLKRIPFTIIGTLAPKGETPMGTDQDDTVIVPLSTAKKRLLGGRRPLASSCVQYGLSPIRPRALMSRLGR